jgi:hypothetical protein
LAQGAGPRGEAPSRGAFSAHVGKMVSLELELKGASVYTIGWSAGAAAAAAEE